MDHLLTIDAGTGSVRASVFAGGEVVATGSRAWAQRPDPRHPGSLDFDTASGWALLCEAVREAVAKAGVPPRTIRAVGVASARGGIVVLDQNRTELFACGAVDARAAAEVRALRAAKPDFEDRAFRRTGHRPEVP